MLQSLEVVNNQGTVLPLSLSDPEDGYVIKDIEGLDPVPAEIVSGSFANADGEQFQSSRRGKRNIVIKLDLRYEFVGQSVGELRSGLYGYFMPKMEVLLRFFDDLIGTVEIRGTVESFSAPLFAKEPEATISILCFKSDFLAPIPSIITGTTNSDYTELAFEYPGTVETGVIFRLFPTRWLTEVTLHHRTPDNIDSSLPFVGIINKDDQLVINTTPGEKGGMLIREFSERSVLYGISPFAHWITLKPGTNFIRVHAEGAAIPFSLEFTKRYGGL